MLAMALQKSESDLQNYMIGFQGRVEAGKAESMAKQYDMQAKMAKIGARQSVISGFLGAGTSAMKSWGSIPEKE